MDQLPDTERANPAEDEQKYAQDRILVLATIFVAAVVTIVWAGFIFLEVAKAVEWLVG